MPSKEIERIKAELGGVGYTLTSFEGLGLPLDEEVANELCERALTSSESDEVSYVVKHIERSGMTIVQDERCMHLARCIMSPVVEMLFADNQAAMDSWSIFGMNRYEDSGWFGSHRDSVDATILLATLRGKREFEIYETPESTPQSSTDCTAVEARFTLEVGSIFILDGEKDPAHAVTQATGLGVVAVADIPLPHLLRTSPTQAA